LVLVHPWANRKQSLRVLASLRSAVQHRLHSYPARIPESTGIGSWLAAVIVYAKAAWKYHLAIAGASACRDASR
jgi:hypothetical protein